MLQRKALKQIHEWYFQTNRKPLVIRGARQVGKTELVRMFARSMNLDLVEINLEETKVYAFEDENFDLNRCINEILLIKEKKMGDSTLVFIDEIQESEQAYQRLRFFKEQRPDLAVIAAGSLLEAKLRKSGQKVPVGRVDYLFLGPLVFSEFLLASGQDGLVELLESAPVRQEQSLTPAVHNKLLQHLLDFFFVGGMPEPVREFVANKGDYLAARMVQQQILQSMTEDIDRYVRGKSARVLREVLFKLPFEIGKKVILSHFSSAKSSYIQDAIDILESIFLLQKVVHSNASGIPLRKTEDDTIYKLYHLDVGLYNCQMEVKWQDIRGLSSDRLLSKGEMAEQFVAQHLYLKAFETSRPRVHYWLRDKTSDRAEVDFVLCLKDRIVPVEVKSGKSGRIKSLVRFMIDHDQLTKEALRFDLVHRPQFREDVRHRLSQNDQSGEIKFVLNNLPLYLVESCTTG